jgi:hypothetical protein
MIYVNKVNLLVIMLNKHKHKLIYYLIILLIIKIPENKVLAEI